MDNDSGSLQSELNAAISAEIQYLRGLSSSKELLLATSNRGAYEALLHIVRAGNVGLPVYQAVSSVGSCPSSQSGTLLRLRAMRAAGIIDEVPGLKKSHVNLVASNQIIEALLPHLMRRGTIQ